MPLVNGDAVGEPAAADEAEDAVTDVPPEHSMAAGDDAAGHLEPGDVLRRARRRRIAARALREVGGIERGVGRNDDDLAAARNRVRPLLEPELFAVEDDRTHDANLRE
jgi:hypothetical protein